MDQRAILVPRHDDVDGVPPARPSPRPPPPGSVIVMQQMGAMMQSIGELTRTVQQLSEKVDGKPSQAL